MKKPFIYKRSDNGFYSIGYYVEGQAKFISTGVKNKNEAQTVFDKWKDDNNYTDFKKPVLLSHFIDIFIPNSTDKNPDTISDYRNVTRQFINVCSDKTINKYNTFDFDKYISWKKSNKTPATASNHRRKLITLFNNAVRWGYVNKNPVVNSIKIKLKESDIIVMPKSDFRKLLNAVDTYENKDSNKMFVNEKCRKNYKELFTFAVLSGLRFNEIQNLKTKDIDLNRKLIKVYGRKTDKTRYVDLNDLLIPLVRNRNNNEYLFYGNSGSQLNIDYLNKTFKKFCKFAGLNPKYTFKCLRATFGKWLLDEGVNLKYISKQLGHSSIQTTEKYYVKYITDEYVGLVNKVTL